MLIVRETFIAKPGHAGELAQRMLKEMKSMPDMDVTIMLDYVTNYNTIVAEYKIENLTEFDKSMDEYRKQQTEQKPKTNEVPYTELYQEGKREIFRIVE